MTAVRWATSVATLALLVGSGFAASVATASARPVCSQVAVATTECARPGHVNIVTAPDPAVRPPTGPYLSNPWSPRGPLRNVPGFAN